MSNIGILGGTFDPIHLGHLVMATYAATELQLDRVLLMPAQTPPHKLGKEITPTERRLAMTIAAAAEDDRLEVSTLDLQSDEPSYTSSLLQRMRAQHPGEELTFIIGADSLRDLPTWHRPDLVIERARIAVASRPGVEIDDAVLDALPRLRERVTIFESPLIDISSTAIRERIRTGRPITWTVPHPVEAYILEHELYR